MVEKYVNVRNKLDSKVFNPYSISTTFIKKSSPIYNDRGELSSETTTETTLNLVPYNLIANRQSYQTFGNLDEGDFDAAIRYDTVINIDDEIVMDDVSFKVKEIAVENLGAPVVKIIRLTKA